MRIRRASDRTSRAGARSHGLRSVRRTCEALRWKRQDVWVWQESESAAKWLPKLDEGFQGWIGYVWCHRHQGLVPSPPPHWRRPPPSPEGDINRVYILCVCVCVAQFLFYIYVCVHLCNFMHAVCVWTLGSYSVYVCMCIYMYASYNVVILFYIYVCVYLHIYIYI